MPLLYYNSIFKKQLVETCAYPSIIIIEVDKFKKIFFQKYPKIIEKNSEAKVITLIHPSEIKIIDKIQNLNIKLLLLKPVGFDKILDLLCWETYVVKSDKIDKFIDNMTDYEKIKSSIRFYLKKRIDLHTYTYVFILSLLVGILLFNPYTPKFIQYLKTTFFVEPLKTELKNTAVEQMYEEIKIFINREEERELKRQEVEQKTQELLQSIEKDIN
jgi:hypothetical protein